MGTYCMYTLYRLSSGVYAYDTVQITSSTNSNIPIALCQLHVSSVVICVLQVTLYHLLKLFQTESALASGKKQLVSEYYDEIVSHFYMCCIDYQLKRMSLGTSYLDAD